MVLAEILKVLSVKVTSLHCCKQHIVTPLSNFMHHNMSLMHYDLCEVVTAWKLYQHSVHFIVS